jgi:Rrf2 family protein
MSYSLGFSQAIAVVLFVADKVQQGIYDFVPTKALSEQLGIATPSAVKILQALNRAGIIETREGARGGVRLAKPPSRVSLLDVFSAVEADRPLFRTDLSFTVAGAKPTRARSAIGAVLDDAEAAMKRRLQGTSVSTLLKQINP